MKIIKPEYKNLSLILMFVLLASLSYCQSPNKHRTKVLLIGIDGASWNVINPLITQGKLPHIKRLMDNGSWGTMQTFQPFVSEVIWTSIATGKKPRKHGIIDNLIEDPDSGEAVPVTSNLRRVKAIWNILSEHNNKVGIVNYIVTRPPEKVNGVMLSDKISVEEITYLSENLSYPQFRYLCSKEEFEGFKKPKTSIFLGMEKDKFSPFSRPIEVDSFMERVDNFIANFSRHLLQKQNFDFFCLYLKGTDLVSHHFWKYLFPEGLDLPQGDIQKYKDVINKYYIFYDKIVGDVLEAAGNFDLVIICSDHGFQSNPNPYALYTPEKIDYLLEACGIKEVKREGRVAILKNKSEDPHSFKKNIIIAGNITGNEFEEIRQRAKDILKEIRVRETGYHIFSNTKDTKRGFIIEVPKLHVSLNPGNHIIIAGKEYNITDFFIKPDSGFGAHSKSAVIILSGKNIERNKMIRDANIYDIAPTILYYMGLPVARDMDGKVLSEAFKKEYFDKNPLKHIDTYDTEKDGKAQNPIRYPDEGLIKERMRSLGYIN